METKMEAASKQGKEYQPPEDPVATFMKEYPKMIRTSLPNTLDTLKDARTNTKLASLSDEAHDAVSSMMKAVTCLRNLTALMNEHTKFVSSALLKFHRLETIPTKFVRALRVTANDAQNAFRECDTFADRFESEKVAEILEDYKQSTRQLDEETTTQYVKELLDAMKQEFDIKEALGKLPQKSDLYKNFRGEGANQLTNTAEGSQYIKTVMKALVMTMQKQSEFPTDQDLLVAVSEKIFLAEQALAIEYTSVTMKELRKIMVHLHEILNDRLNDEMMDLLKQFSDAAEVIQVHHFIKRPFD
ncbi:unnamed protein product [Notodromas monacha]|uniref:Uncharacterized protein n=1 Tax=Notodromas monacha TaxID=399045 RepID=A0A7R9C0G9_9CRUS|nr:unnamed protein product [Notodromas monacha]CAG0925173.1 unnamed protein product [Notodromas monacha]